MSTTDQLVSHDTTLKQPPVITGNARNKPLLDEHLSEFFFIRERRGYKRLRIEEVVYVESSRNYIRIHTKTGMHLIGFSLDSFEKAMINNNFLRIHRRYLINIAYLDFFDRMEAHLSGIPVPFPISGR